MLPKAHQLGRNLLRRITGDELLLALAVVAVAVVLALGFGWENNKLVPANSSPTAHYTQERGNHLSFTANWDGPDYLALASRGYQDKVQANFFPLYPLLIRAVTVVVRSPLYSALLITWASLVGALYFYLKIFKDLYRLADNREALRGVIFFVLFPTGVFLLVPYTESLFAFLALGATYFALRKRYLPAALFGLGATLTHVTGVFVLALVALLLWEKKEKLWRIALGLAIGGLGTLSYMAFLLIKFHNPIAFVASQKTNGWLNYGHTGLLAELLTRKAVFLLILLLGVAYWWRRRRSFALYTALYVCIAFLGGLGAFGRYALMAFPVQIMAYDYLRRKKYAYPLMLAFSASFWMYYLLQYMAGYSGG